MFESLSDKLKRTLKNIRGEGVLTQAHVEAALREIRLALLEADVNYKVAKDFIAAVREKAEGQQVWQELKPSEQVVKIVFDELVNLLGGQSSRLVFTKATPNVVMIVGLQGSGKTTSAVKLALLARREGHRPLVAALDLRRPAAVDQLRTLAEQEHVAFHTGEGAVETIALAAVAEARRVNCDVVVLDTAGRTHVDADLMAELKRVKAALPAAETLLVADSMTGQEAVKVGEAFGREVGVDGVIMTKLDGDARGGAALSLRVATGEQIRFAGTGEKPADLEVFHAERMASRILGMGDVLSLIEKAGQTVDREKAAEVERHLRAGQLSFDDFLAQIRQLRGMGSLEGLLDMVPGGGQLKGQLAGANTELEMKRMEAIILSMTPRERAHPELIDGARKKRIARGSGVQPADINRLLKARDAMQKMAKQFGAVNRRGKPVGIPRLGQIG